MMQVKARREDEKAMRSIEKKEEELCRQKLGEVCSRREEKRQEKRKLIALEREENALNNVKMSMGDMNASLMC